MIKRIKKSDWWYDNIELFQRIKSATKDSISDIAINWPVGIIELLSITDWLTDAITSNSDDILKNEARKMADKINEYIKFVESEWDNAIKGQL